MTQPTVTPEVAVGACLACNAVILVTPANPNCRLCGRPPAYTMPFVDATTELTPVVVVPPEPEPAPEPFNGSEGSSWPEVLFDGIYAYLADGEITEKHLRDGFSYMGADPEDAATAVGRLAAVRDLIRQLESDFERSVAPPGGPGAVEETAEVVAPSPAAEPPPEPPPSPTPEARPTDDD